MEVNQRIDKLRQLMNEKGIDAYIIPTYDPHQSEYLADHYKARTWISGFTGSAGTVVITQKEAILWTDGRYFIQAEKELRPSEIKLSKMGIPGFPTYTEWLNDNLDKGDTLGFDGKIVPQSDVERLEKAFGKKEIKFVDEYDLVGEIWEDRPEAPNSKAFIHELKYTGKTAKEKIENVREKMKKEDISHFILASLDDIAWLYNIRARDVNNNPVIISYALITEDKAFFFADENKIDNDVKLYLKGNGIEIQDYNKIIDYVKNIEDNSNVFIDPNRINRWLYNAIPDKCEVKRGTNITTELKGIKNPTEIENQKNAYIKDGVALVKFMYWLDENVGKTTITEVSAAEKLEDFRKEQEGFIEPSFDTIAAFKENAAMMHYKAEDGKSNYELEPKGMLLVDSGGQYYDGTTDITRTIILGDISEEEKRDYTLTLKSHINLINARFLYGISGAGLDAIARYPLWQDGLDYKSGTDHGVGFLLNVHEGPHGMGLNRNNVVFEKGMIITIEPGVYKEGKHGIRIENVAVVEEDIVTESGQFMKFEPLSYVPIDLEGVDVELLSKEEIKWLNDYHEEVYNKLSPYLTDKEKQWLKNETRNI